MTGATIGEALIEGEQRLRKCGSPRPRRHTELLLESALKVDRTELYLRAREPLTLSSYQQYTGLLNRREAGEPVQHIVGWAPFYGYRFLVSAGVFIPRFDTELLVERVLKTLEEGTDSNDQVEILDLCSGCGAIGLSIAAEHNGTRVTLADVSLKALEYSARNALALMVNDRVDPVEWDALKAPPEEWDGRFRCVVANPPYIPVNEIIDLHPDVQREPHMALTDEGDGLTFYRRWAETVPQMLKPNGSIYFEIGDKMADDVVKILEESFGEIEVLKDMNGLDRMVEGRKPHES